MPVTFKSKATGDLLMLSAHAEQVLALLHKTAKQPGILQTHEMLSALHILRSLPDASVEDEAPPPHEDAPSAPPPHGVPMSDGISLRKRAWPLVRMIEAAHAGNEAIVWGV